MAWAFFLVCGLVALACCFGIAWKLIQLVWYVSWGSVLVVATLLGLLLLGADAARRWVLRVRTGAAR